MALLSENDLVEKDIVIFGAGQVGRMALMKYKTRTLFIVDNNKKLHGTFLDGVEIRSVESLSSDADYVVMIASKHQDMMEKQLQQLGISRYDFYLKDSKVYYDTEELVFNPYEDNTQRDISEEEWNTTIKLSKTIETVNSCVEEIYGKNMLFDHVEIETINRCNGGCEFCPVSVKNDTREYKEMSWELFEKIINQLAEINYSGKVALF